MAKSVEPDQTALSEAVWFGSALSAYAIFIEILVYEIWWHLVVLQVNLYTQTGN